MEIPNYTKFTELYRITPNYTELHFQRTDLNKRNWYFFTYSPITNKSYYSNIKWSVLVVIIR